MKIISSPVAGISVIDKQPENKNENKPNTGKAANLPTAGTGSNDGAYLKSVKF